MKKTIITILALITLISCKKTFIQPDFYMLNFIGELQTGNPNDTHVYLKYENYKYQIRNDRYNNDYLIDNDTEFQIIYLVTAKTNHIYNKKDSTKIGYIYDDNLILDYNINIRNYNYVKKYKGKFIK